MEEMEMMEEIIEDMEKEAFERMKYDIYDMEGYDDYDYDGPSYSYGGHNRSRPNHRQYGRYQDYDRPRKYGKYDQGYDEYDRDGRKDHDGGRNRHEERGEYRESSRSHQRGERFDEEEHNGRRFHGGMFLLIVGFLIAVSCGGLMYCGYRMGRKQSPRNDPQFHGVEMH